MKLTEEMQNNINNIKEKAHKECIDLIICYADELNPYHKNDIIEDHYQIGKIVSWNIKVHVNSLSFDIVYKCERLKKNLTPFKSKEPCSIFLCNVKNKH